MSMYSAPSDLDYYAEASGLRRGVRFTCPSCARDFWIARDEPYPGGRPLCDTCSRDAERRTHYAVQRKSDAWWWMFDGLFHPNRDFARRFACASVAQLQAEAECLADPRDWTVEPVEGV